MRARLKAEVGLVSRRHRQVFRFFGLVAPLAILNPALLPAQDIPWDRLSLAQGADLDIGEGDSANTGSTVVKLRSLRKR